MGTWIGNTVGRIRRRLESTIRSKHAGTGVFLASLAETTFVPIPIEVVLLPAMLGHSARALRFAALALAGCLVGATIGYGVGMLAWATIGEWFVSVVGLDGRVAEAKQKIAHRGFWYILFVAISPAPFQLAYLGAGLLAFSYPLFLGASVIGRGARYFGFVLLVLVFGKAAGPWLDRNGVWFGIAITVVFIAVYAMLTWLLS